jgi:hypothetical protein
MEYCELRGVTPQATTMAHRTFKDSSGRRWDVWTVTPGHRQRPTDASGLDQSAAAEELPVRNMARVLLGDRLASGWLAFETSGEKRRMAPYPENWAALTASELEMLCHEAIPAPPPRRLVE